MNNLQASPPPPLRADARRNRDAILTAARSVFAEHGLDAPLDLIAKQAGVGRATLYRRFTTRDELISAIFDDNFEHLAEVGREATDPSRAYLEILQAALDQQQESLGFIQLFSRRPPEAHVMEAIGERWAEVIAEPLKRAQSAGLVRPDLNTEDSGMILVMIGAATAHLVTNPDREARRSRVIALIYDAIDPANAPRELV